MDIERSELPPDLDERVAALAALQEPLRRALYLYILGRRDAVGRDEAARAVGIRRGLAAFHLDRLADDGLLTVEYRRLTGRSGPGAGRPAKLYRVAPHEHDVSLPPRSYAFAAELLADAVEASRPGGSGETAEEVAERRGRQVATAARESLDTSGAGDHAGEGTPLAAVLSRFGYQPSGPPGSTELLNCPFHALAESHRELICGMNAAFLTGVIEGLGLRTTEARLEPEIGRCCVVIRSVSEGG